MFSTFFASPSKRIFAPTHKIFPFPRGMILVAALINFSLFHNVLNEFAWLLLFCLNQILYYTPTQKLLCLYVFRQAGPPQQVELGHHNR